MTVGIATIDPQLYITELLRRGRRLREAIASVFAAPLDDRARMSYVMAAGAEARRAGALASLSPFEIKSTTPPSSLKALLTNGLVSVNTTIVTRAACF